MKVLFVSPWYPDYANPHSGIFVAKQVEAVANAGVETRVVVPQIFPAPSGPVPDEVMDAMSSLATSSPDAMFGSDVDVKYVPTPVPARGGPLGRANSVVTSLNILREHVDLSADLVHAHVGLPAGLAASSSGFDAPLVVTEHWSGLAAALEAPETATAYLELIQAADAFICVSQHLKDQIVDAVGDQVSESIQVIPNIVDLTDIDFKDHRPYEFKSWIYVGGLMPHKGVQLLLRSFAHYLKHHDSGATLTLVGEGPLRDWIEMFAISRELGDSVQLAGSVPHDSLGSHLGSADVMVHLSPVETFGIASLEGIGAGLPVVSLSNQGALSAWGEIEEKCGVLLALDASAEDVSNAVAGLRTSPETLDLAYGRSQVEERYSSEVVGSQLLDLYQALLQ